MTGFPSRVRTVLNPSSVAHAQAAGRRLQTKRSFQDTSRAMLPSTRSLHSAPRCRPSLGTPAPPLTAPGRQAACGGCAPASRCLWLCSRRAWQTLLGLAAALQWGRMLCEQQWRQPSSRRRQQQTTPCSSNRRQLLLVSSRPLLARRRSRRSSSSRIWRSLGSNRWPALLPNSHVCTNGSMFPGINKRPEVPF